MLVSRIHGFEEQVQALTIRLDLQEHARSHQDSFTQYDLKDQGAISFELETADLLDEPIHTPQPHTMNQKTTHTSPFKASTNWQRSSRVQDPMSLSMKSQAGTFRDSVRHEPGAMRQYAMDSNAVRNDQYSIEASGMRQYAPDSNAVCQDQYTIEASRVRKDKYTIDSSTMRKDQSQTIDAENQDVFRASTDPSKVECIHVEGSS